jgi:hypothetical protein
MTKKQYHTIMLLLWCIVTNTAIATFLTVLGCIGIIVSLVCILAAKD